MHFADRMIHICQTKATRLVVGLDPHWKMIPQNFKDRHGDQPGKVIAAYMIGAMDATAEFAAAYKPQIAFFERFGIAGLQALSQILDKAAELEIPIIMDGKRNDIGSTAAAYAGAYFGDENGPAAFPADALTVNAYLGSDGIKPFLSRPEHGIFALVKTSNPSSGDFQDVIVSGDKTIADLVAETLCRWNQQHLGASGFGNIGAVVGATWPDHMRKLRAAMPDSLILVPGYGAQGGAEEAVSAAFDSNGLGALINSSRGVLFPRGVDDQGFAAVTEAARTARDHINRLAGV